MVKRYEPQCETIGESLYADCNAEMKESDSGDYVTYDDYQKLQRRLDVLERAKRIWERRNGDASDLNDASQEANHYNWLDEQNEILQQQIENAENIIKYYADRMNYTLDDDYGISGEMRRRVILYGDQEEFNECSSAAGRRARQYFKDKENK